MKDYELLLKMIEDVSSDDTKTLDKINILTLKLITEVDIDRIEIDYDGSVYATNASGEEVDLRRCYYASEINFTYSRDALKKVRLDELDDWNFCINKCESGYYSSMWRNQPDYYVNRTTGQYFSTETLAELHTIIQAIAYKRNLK